MLPPELLDQITSLNTQHRELLSIIHKLSRHTEIRSQLDLDDLVLQIKAKFVEADQVIEVRDHFSLSYHLELETRY
jgi:CHASE3 domain sensor protein